MNKRNKIVLTCGTFDLLHTGHINLLRRAKTFGDYLIVGLSTNKFNKLKNKDNFLPYKQRKVILEAIKYVDKVIPERNQDQEKSDAKKYKVDVFVIGDDYRGEFDELREHCEVIYLKRTPNISTTSLKRSIAKKINSNMCDTRGRT